jgi:hypothetical protein
LVDQTLEKALNDIRAVAEGGIKNFAEVYPESTPTISDKDLFNHIVEKAKEREAESRRLYRRRPPKPAEKVRPSNDLSVPDEVTRLSHEGQRSSEEPINPFFRVLSTRKFLKIRRNSFCINRVIDGSKSFETSMIWSYKTFALLYDAKFKDPIIGNNIDLFRQLIGLYALAKMLNVDIPVCSEQELNSDFIDITLSSILGVRDEDLPKDIGNKLRTFCDQVYVDFSETNFATVEQVYEIWNNALIRSNEGFGHAFCGIASTLLQIGIAVWTPDKAKAGDYLLSHVFGESFQDTIHLVAHTEGLDVSTTSLNTRYINSLKYKH